MSDGLVLISLTTCDSGNPGASVHSRSWRIPARSAEAFAQAMTERYGEPVQEGLSTVGATREAAEQNAEDGFLFMDGEGAPNA